MTEIFRWMAMILSVLLSSFTPSAILIPTTTSTSTTSTTIVTTTLVVTTTTIPPTTTPTLAAAPARDIWWLLALCEDGGKNRYFAPYSGYFHFLPSTYYSVGGVNLPHEDSYETQKGFAIKLQKQSGWGQWPGCARKLGLL